MINAANKAAEIASDLHRLSARFRMLAVEIMRDTATSEASADLSLEVEAVAHVAGELDQEIGRIERARQEAHHGQR